MHHCPQLRILGINHKIMANENNAEIEVIDLELEETLEGSAVCNGGVDWSGIIFRRDVQQVEQREDEFYNGPNDHYESTQTNRSSMRKRSKRLSGDKNLKTKNRKTVPRGSTEGKTKTTKTLQAMDISATNCSSRCNCKFCLMTFEVPADRDNHIKEVHGKRPKPYICSTCGMDYATIYSLKCHKSQEHRLSDKHPATDIEMFICPQCGKACKGRYLLKSHIYSVHKKNRMQKTELSSVHASSSYIPAATPLPSKIISLPINPSENIQAEIQRRLNNPKPYVCHQCYEEFPSSVLINYHKRNCDHGPF